MISDDARDDLLDFVSSWACEHAVAGSLQEAEQLGLEVGAMVRRAVAQEAVSSSIARFEQSGSSLACQCGGSARMVGRRERVLVSMCGQVKARRRYYHCRDCGTGYAPWDRAQGMTQRQFTPAVKALVAELATHLSYSDTVMLLKRTTGLGIEESSAEQVVEEVGTRVREDQRERTRRILAGEVLGEKSPKKLYVGVDGTHAHIDGAWHEVKVGVIYDDAGHKQYLAARESAEKFGERTYAAAVEAGVETAAEVVVIGDGAEWIWNLAALHFPDAIEIVDYWHACEHICEAANACYGEGTKAARGWAEDYKRRLFEEGCEPLLRSLRAMRPDTLQGLEAVRLARGYFGRHRKRMRYPQFRRRGLAIGSGPVEAACKVIVGQRLKRAGMRWTDAGADHILALRCLLKSGDHHRLHQHSRPT